MNSLRAVVKKYLNQHDSSSKLQAELPDIKNCQVHARCSKLLTPQVKTILHQFPTLRFQNNHFNNETLVKSRHNLCVSSIKLITLTTYLKANVNIRFKKPML